MLDSFVPGLRPGVYVSERDDGSAVLFEPGEGAYVEVAADQASLATLVDGVRSVSAIAAEHLERRRFIPFQALGDLLATLRAAGLLRNSAAEMDEAGIPAPAKGRRFLSFASARLARLRLPGLGPVSGVALAACAGLLLVAAGLCVGRDPLWPLHMQGGNLPGGGPLAGLLSALLGASLALTSRSLARAGVATISGAPPLAIELRLHYGVPTLGVEGGPATRLHRGRRMAAHLAALATSPALAFVLLVLYEGEAWAGAAALGALLVAFADACPIAPTSLGATLAAAAGQVDLRDHARSYLSRRFLARVASSELFAGERIIIVTTTLATLWATLGADVVLRRVPALLVFLYRAANDLAGADAAAGWVGIGVVGLGSLAGLALMLQTLFAAFISAVPRSLIRRPARAASAAASPALADPRALLKRTPLFAGLPDAALEQIAKEVEKVSFPAGAIVVRQGDPGDRFYALVEGGAEVEVEHASGLRRVVAKLGPGDCFGETALLSPVPRTATVRTSAPVVALALAQHGFARLTAALGTGEITRFIRASAALQRSPLFRTLPAERISSLLPKLGTRVVDAGAAAVKRGEPGDFFYLVDEGSLEVLDEKDEPLATLGPGDHFGEVALLRDVPRTATVRAASRASLFSLSRPDFFAVLVRDLSLSRALEEQARARVKGG